jgi:hypothetical protein
MALDVETEDGLGRLVRLVGGVGRAGRSRVGRCRPGSGVGDGGVRQYAADPAAAAITAMDAAVTAMEVLQVRAAWPPARQQILRDLDGYPVSDGVKASLTERVRNLDVNIELMREYTNDGGTKNFK